MYGELLRATIVGTSAYALYLSATAGILLNGYKKISDKASKVSSTARKDTAQTERTVGLSVLTAIFSLASIGYVYVVPGWSGYLALFNTFLASLCYKVVQAYWTPEHKSSIGKLPGAKDYAVAWGKMVEMKFTVIGLGGMWCLLTMMST